MIAVCLLIIICSFIVVHHLYKIRDSLNAQLKDLRSFQNNISIAIDRIEHLLGQIDSCIEDIDDKIEIVNNENRD